MSSQNGLYPNQQPTQAGYGPAIPIPAGLQQQQMTPLQPQQIMMPQAQTVMPMPNMATQYQQQAPQGQAIPPLQNMATQYQQPVMLPGQQAISPYMAPAVPQGYGSVPVAQQYVQQQAPQGQAMQIHQPQGIPSESGQDPELHDKRKQESDKKPNFADILKNLKGGSEGKQQSVPDEDKKSSDIGDSDIGDSDDGEDHENNEKRIKKESGLPDKERDLRNLEAAMSEDIKRDGGEDVGTKSNNASHKQESELSKRTSSVRSYTFLSIAVCVTIGLAVIFAAPLLLPLVGLAVAKGVTLGVGIAIAVVGSLLSTIIGASRYFAVINDAKKGKISSYDKKMSADERDITSPSVTRKHEREASIDDVNDMTSRRSYEHNTRDKEMKNLDTVNSGIEFSKGR